MLRAALRLTLFFIYIFLVTPGGLQAQVGPPVAHPRNAQKRYEIDAKRTGTDPESDDALPRSREFIRTDSSYYVGWLYEGMYKVNHAADYLGYKNAIIPLRRALAQIERDYARMLRTRTSDLMTYFPAYRFQLDYSLVAYNLMECYNNVEQPQDAYNVIRRSQRWNFQREFYMQSYNYLAWTVHRNRFYTKAKYPFLKNSIPENEQLANAFLDSAFKKIRTDKRLNSALFQPGYEESEMQSVYHYKAMLYSYALNIDSAARYYDRMRNYSIFSHNNYATFLSICGDFRQAAFHYNIARTQDQGDKRLQEWAYYSSLLDIYKGKPETGIQNMKDMIKASGSTPGFGWYNIALARCCMYNGDVAESERYIKKAEQFKEVHIGTTLGQSHYDFSINMIKLMNNISRIQQVKFENRNWLYSPVALSGLAQQSSAKYLLQYLIVNQFAMNPERDLVIYRLFSTESTVSWDEIWYLMRDFSTQFFYQKFAQELKDDQRPLIKKYFRLYMARLQMKKNNYTDAEKLLREILSDVRIDAEYEKLLIARSYEAMAECAQARKNKAAYNESLYGFYVTYPQLLPFSELRPNMRLSVIGTPDAVIVDRLKSCNINWVSDRSIPAPEVTLKFSRNGSKKTITYFVTDKSGKEIVSREDYTYTEKPEQAAVTLAYRLFNTYKKAPPADPKQ
ncbi:hypothetical protein B0I18_103215 [Taibaiella chishuiensis]|uniref:Tetratricopeptide repeat protein n=2 Tax=Taibaiella chishuiensis TaxID=1434707 RepID=A0A2P8D606_9BACT|nr:hypothetical protein B0I18_103215 [Taibaiella chishuiensis]